LRSAVAPVRRLSIKDLGPPRSILLETGSEKGPFALAGQDSVRQLLVTGRFAGDVVRDLTGAVTYEASPPGIVSVDATGLVTPRKEGKATIRVRTANGLTA